MAAPLAREKGERQKKNLTLIDFGGVNVQARRQAIEDNEFAWLENAMPVGAGNMRIVAAPSSALATIAPDVMSTTFDANISGSDFVFAFCASGAAYSVNLTNGLYTTTKIANAGTFSGSGVQATQWKNAGILIVDPVKGYFDYNVTTANTLTPQSNTVVQLTIVTIGAGYTSTPTIGFSGGGGSGAAATADIQMGLATVSNAGTGYQVGDILTISGGTAVTAAQIKVTSVGASNAITGISIQTSGDYTAAPTNPASVTGGYGSGATFTLNFGIGPIKLTSVGSGYTSAPTVTVSGGGGNAGTLTAQVNSGLNGTSIAVYAGRVWIATGRTLNFSDVNSYTNFSTGASGNLFITDATLHNTITGLYVANNFLYIFGDDSIDVLGNVTVSGGITSFTRTNVTDSIGSNMQNSFFTFYRGLFFANPIGFHALLGSTPQKISDKLDTLVNAIQFSSLVTGGEVAVFNTLCAAFLFTFADSFTPTGGTRAMFALFFNKKWWFASGSTSLKACLSVPLQGSPTLFAWDSSNLYQMFANSPASVSTRVQTKLYDGGTPTLDKQAMKLGLGVTYLATVAESDNITVDNEYQSSTPAVLGSNSVIFTTNGGNPITFATNNGVAINFTIAGYSLTKSDVSLNAGKYLGGTITSTSPQLIINELLIEYEEGARW